MKQILMIRVSPRGKDSASRSVAETLAARLNDLYPTAKLVRRDLAAESLPSGMVFGLMTILGRVWTMAA
jgi:FMN-dependent NADH-azoreductase